MGRFVFTYFEILYIMKRLSLEELKAQKAEQVKENLEAVNGGKMDLCHFVDTFWEFVTTRTLFLM